MDKFTSTLAAALWWVELGRFPVPVPLGEKGPTLPAWQELRPTAKDLAQFFSGHCNIGVLHGEPRGAADADLDCLEAMAAWLEYAPPTGLIFGRLSKPASHYFYQADPPLKSKRFTDPVGKKTILELRCLTADGKVGFADSRSSEHSP